MATRCFLFRSLRTCLIFIVPPGMGCSTTSETAGPPVRTHYTLRTEEVVSYPKPLPDKTSIYIDWHFSDGSVQSRLASRGWDFDGNGTVEALEVIDKNQTTSWIFDFDGDGKIDFQKPAKE